MNPGRLFFLMSICLLLFFSRVKSSSAHFVFSYQDTTLRNKKIINQDTNILDTALIVGKKINGGRENGRKAGYI